jgi:hypothetical protein
MEGNNMKVMGKATVTLFLMLIVSLFMTSCSGVVTPELQLGLDEEINKVEEIVSIYLDVPYEKYAGANWCLPASGAMTFKYFVGFEAKYNFMTLEEVKDLLKSDIPVIAVQSYSLTLPYSHARVIIGFDDEKQEVISNDPTAGEDYIMSYSDFTALNTGSNPDLFKVIVISTEEIDTKDTVLANNENNS